MVKYVGYSFIVLQIQYPSYTLTYLGKKEVLSG